MDNLGEARKIATLMDGDDRVKAFLIIGLLSGDDNDFSSAIKELPKVLKGSVFHVLFVTVNALTFVGKLEQAHKLILSDSLKNNLEDEEKDQTLKIVVQSYLDKGDIKTAVQIAEEFSTDKVRADVWRTIAMACFKKA